VAAANYRAWAARDFRAAHRRWPTEAELLAADPTLARTDPWRNEFCQRTGPDGLVVVSAGVDGRFDTADDIASAPVRVADPTR
jgi:hypothetical protein